MKKIIELHNQIKAHRDELKNTNDEKRIEELNTLINSKKAVISSIAKKMADEI